MPVIVIGADTPTGRAIVEALVEPEREVRAFVTDPEVGAELRSLGVKVATGDISDATHIEGASTRCFSAVLIEEAATDSRERSFARDIAAVFRAWADGISAAGVSRAIWVTAEPVPDSKVGEVAVVSPDRPELVETVVALDDVRILDTG